MHVPSAFCWSKFGTEAGEQVASILERKERERQTAGGVFLWGIGTSIRPSLMELADLDPSPLVLFTPMLSRPLLRDSHPSRVVTWTSAVGMDGRPYTLPAGAVVTSAVSDRRHHYALVCSSHQPILEQPEDTWIDPDQLENLVSGMPIGSSQVTSVVRRRARLIPEPRYRVAFRARLRAPYLLVLSDPKAEPGSFAGKLPPSLWSEVGVDVSTAEVLASKAAVG